MFILRKFAASSNTHRLKLRSSVNGQGLTGLSSASSGLIISTITDNEATAVSYSVAGGTIESISTPGTYAAPTTNKCRFKEVDAANQPGLYEIQLADARYAVSGAKLLRISFTGAANLLDRDITIQLTAFDPDDAQRMGQSALPSSGSIAAQSGDAYARLGANGAGLTALGDARLAHLDADISSRNATAPPTAAANAAAVRSELATELGRLDASVSSRAATGAAMTLTGGERTAIANEVEAQIIDDTDSEKVLQAIVDKIAAANPSLDDLTLGGIASAVRSELATELSRLDAAISSRMASFAYTAPPTAAQNAGATRTELAAELVHLNADVSSAVSSASSAATAAGNAAANTQELPGLIEGGAFTSAALIHAGGEATLDPDVQEQINYIAAKVAPLRADSPIIMENPIIGDGEIINRKQGVTWTVSYACAGDVSDAVWLWALKKSPADADSVARLLVRSDSGLQTLNAAPAGDEEAAAITASYDVESDSTTITITVAAEATTQLVCDSPNLLMAPKYWALKRLSPDLSELSGPFLLSDGVIDATA